MSGCGWLFDVCLLATLVEVAKLGPAWANLISSLCAASVVFLVSRERIFSGAAGSPAARLAVYLTYTALQVAVASAAIGLLARPIAGEARLLGLAGVATLAAVLAKIIVTPVQLGLNFVVAGRLNRADPRHLASAHG